MLDTVQQLFKAAEQSWSTREIFSKMSLHKMSYIQLNQNTCLTEVSKHLVNTQQICNTANTTSSERLFSLEFTEL